MSKKFLLSAMITAIILAGAAYFYSGKTPTDSPSEVITAEVESHSAPNLTEHAEQAHINWYEGTVDQAFAEAKETDTPIVLYWGAVWCPPCAQLKATIFKRRDFIEKTELFISVYLDGDTDRAQVYGETFKVRGYPTLIIFNPSGEEVTRIPGGMNLQRYVEVLDLALNDIRPAATLLAEIIDNGYVPTENEIRLLAHYSWGQDAGQALGERDKVDVFKRLADMTPELMIEEKSRFNAEYLEQLAEVEDPIEDDVKADAVIRLTDLIDDPQQSRANLYFIPYSVAKVLKVVTDEGTEERQAIVAKWQSRLNVLRLDASFSAAERMRIFAGEIRLAKLDSEDIPDELKARIRAAVERERAGAEDAYESIVVTNASVGILMDSDQNELASEVLQAELETSNTGYYWMADLAYFAQEAEQTEEALKWLKMAYDQAEGIATRIQWGSIYVTGLTEMNPDDLVLLEDTVSQIFDELDAQDEAIHGRNKGSLKRIGRNLNKWVETEEPTPERALLRERLVARFDTMCAAQFDDPTEQKECLDMFAEAKEA